MIIVSACLAGLATSYDGNHRACREVMELLERGIALPLCPEQLGGLPTPRPPAEIQAGDGASVLAGQSRVRNLLGQDITAAFARGAWETQKVAQIVGCRHAILKARSPSCARGQIYDGSFTGTIRAGFGVTAWLLIEQGIQVWTEAELDCPYLRSLLALD